MHVVPLFMTSASGNSVLLVLQSWRSRPLILHKIADPLHMHYLHWRLLHCAIPRHDLPGPAQDFALRDIPADVLHRKVPETVYYHLTWKQEALTC